MIVMSPSVAELLADLDRHGINLQAHGDAIRYRPQSAMTPALLQRLQVQKAELLNLLDTDAVVTKLRQSIASLWKDPSWQSAWKRRFQRAQYADFESLQRVLAGVIDGAAELHRRHKWDPFAVACRNLYRIASGEIWDQVELAEVKFPPI